jgi:hypothetical protein
MTMVSVQRMYSNQVTLLSAAELFTHSTRRAIAYLGLWTQHSAARAVHIESVDLGVIRQCFLHLPSSVETVSVPVSGLLENESWPWPISVKGAGSTEAEVTLYPLSLENGAREPMSPGVIGCFRNTFSYRKLFYPRQPSLTIGYVQNLLERCGYAIQRMVGVCPPHFILWWMLGAIVGVRAPSLHFQFSNYALQHLVKSRGKFRYLSYLVVFYACR